jgi:bifunctional DNase/RNase
MANIEVNIEGIRVNDVSHQRVVILKEKSQERYLAIWIRPDEVDNMVVKLQQVKIPRPLTHDLICAVIHMFGGNVSGVVINEVRGDDFSAKLMLTGSGGVIEIPCRPSDGMGLAIREKAPIFVESSILDIFNAFGPDTPHPYSSKKERPPAHPTRKCASCGSSYVELVYGDEHERYKCFECGQIFQ